MIRCCLILDAHRKSRRKVDQSHFWQSRDAMYVYSPCQSHSPPNIAYGYWKDETTFVLRDKTYDDWATLIYEYVYWLHPRSGGLGQEECSLYWWGLRGWWVAYRFQIYWCSYLSLFWLVVMTPSFLPHGQAYVRRWTEVTSKTRKSMLELWDLGVDYM